MLAQRQMHYAKLPDADPGGHVAHVKIAMARETADPAHDAKARAEFTRALQMATLGQALAGIAHEVKQPLAAVVTNANAALRWLKAETPNVAEAKLALERVVNNGHRVGETIQNIRAMLERKSPAAAAVDLNAVVGETLALLDGELRAHDVKLVVDLADGLPPVPIDRMQLQQVVLNLVMNAIEAMEATAGRPRVLRVAGKFHDEEAMLTVEDCGAGIAAENMDRIFSPFFTTKPHALGLGLTMCRSIVEAQGGRVHVAALPHGTAFHVVLAANKSETG